MNKTDRELLELAARAAGIEIKGLTNGDKGDPVIYFDHSTIQTWNPLEDDGDALRLVVRLKQLDLWAKPYTGVGISGWKEDPYAATRRAIVRAAAEIGKEM